MKNAIITLLFLATFNIGFSCSFIPKPFCMTINVENPDNVVLKGYFSSTLTNGLVFTRLETLRGDEERDQINIWDNHPFDCNGWHFRLASYLGNLNEEVIISVNQIGEDSLYFIGAEPGDYQVPENLWHETHSLKVNGDSIQGYFFMSPDYYPTDESIHYDDFIEDIMENTSCSITSTNESEEKLINIYPTLVVEELYLEYNSSLIESQTLIYDSNGRIVLTKKISPSIHLGLLEKGMYIVVIQTVDNKCYHQKIIKL